MVHSESIPKRSEEREIPVADLQGAEDIFGIDFSDDPRKERFAKNYQENLEYFNPTEQALAEDFLSIRQERIADLSHIAIDEESGVFCIERDGQPVFFEILGHIGEGGYGSVVLARNADNPKEHVVMKKMVIEKNKSLISQGSRRRTFEEECRVLAELAGQSDTQLKIHGAIGKKGDTYPNHIYEADELYMVLEDGGINLLKECNQVADEMDTYIVRQCKEIEKRQPDFCQLVSEREVLFTDLSTKQNEYHQLQAQYEAQKSQGRDTRSIKSTMASLNNEINALRKRYDDVYNEITTQWIEQLLHDGEQGNGWLENRISTMKPMLEALKDIHKSGYVWSDFKPENASKKFVFDAGGARKQGKAMYFANELGVMSTPMFASPTKTFYDKNLVYLDYDQVQDLPITQDMKDEIFGMQTYYDSICFDTRDDIYSLALTLYEQLSALGVPPMSFVKYEPSMEPDVEGDEEKIKMILEKKNKNFLFHYFQLHGLYAKQQNNFDNERILPPEYIRALSCIDDDAQIPAGLRGVYRRIQAGTLQTGDLRAQRPDIDTLSAGMERCFQTIQVEEVNALTSLGHFLNTPEGQNKLHVLFEQLYETDRDVLFDILDVHSTKGIRLKLKKSKQEDTEFEVVTIAS